MDKTSWKEIAAGAGFGVIGAMMWATAKVAPMKFEDAKDKARYVVDMVLEEVRKRRGKAFPAYVNTMAEELVEAVSAEIWEAYDRGRMVGKGEARSETVLEVQGFLHDQEAMAKQRAVGEVNNHWNVVAREMKAAANTIGARFS